VDALIYAAVAALILVNVVTTARVVRTESYSGHQKAIQAALVWLVPILGALMVWLVARQVAAESEPPHADHFSDPTAVAGSYDQGPSFDSGGAAGGDGD
jgi:hypothetical protein